MELGIERTQLGACELTEERRLGEKQAVDELV